MLGNLAELGNRLRDALSQFVWVRCDEFQFLNQQQLASLIPALAESKNRPMGRFVIQWHSAKGAEREPKLHYWLAECQPVEGLVKRINVIAERFCK